MEKLFETITNEIGLKVEKHIQIRKLFTPKEDVDYKEQLEDALKLIQQGRRILISWKDNYQSVRNVQIFQYIYWLYRLEDLLKMITQSVGISLRLS